MKYNTKKTLAYYWQAMNHYKWWGLLLVSCIVVATVIDAIVPIYFKNFFNILTDNKARSVIVAGLLSTLLIIGIYKLGRWLLWRVGVFVLNFYESRIMTDLSENCFEYLHRHSFTYFSNTFTGSVVKKSKSFVNAFETLADQTTFDLIPTLVMILVMTIVLTRVNVILGGGMFLWLVLLVVINWKFTIYKLKFDIKRSEAETVTSSYLADTVSNNINLKLFNGFEVENKGYSDLMEKLYQLRRYSWDLSAIFYGVQSFLMLILEVGIFYVAIMLWRKNVLTVGDFVLIQSYVIEVIVMVWDFGRVITRIYEYLAEAEEMTVLLETPHDIIDKPDAKELKVKQGEIEFKDVSFAYEGGEKVVSDFTLKIDSRETVALVGLSGAGKTTLVKLLLRLHDLSKGKILIDGQDISRVTQESLRDNVSLVPQDPILFHRSLLENIRYGKFGATDEEVFRAAKLAHCDEFIGKLKNGYQTFVGERGIKLSGGERQRVAIARAILRDAPILILDEATSSLDSESEKYIQDSLDELMKNKTVMVIAHRLSTIKKADRIVVIDNKKVVEDGSHQSLIKIRSGIYKKLWEIQVGGFIK